MSVRFVLLLLVSTALFVATFNPLTTTSKAQDSASIQHYEVDILNTETHDKTAFTQGFLLHQEKLYESTGLYGKSSLREVSLEGQVLRSVNLSEEEFGEGLALLNQTLVQLTWKNGTAYLWDLETFTQVGNFTYSGEGWGLCSQDGNFVMSNGSADLTIRNGSDFSVLETISVTYNGTPLEEMNELECVGDLVYANVWHREWIFIINLTSGEVVGTIDATLLFPTSDDAGVLNGIAYDSDNDSFWLTGKKWPNMYEVTLRAVAGNGDEDANAGNGSQQNNSVGANDSILVKYTILGLASATGFFTYILWGNGFGAFTVKREVDNPPVAPIDYGEQE